MIMNIENEKRTTNDERRKQGQGAGVKGQVEETLAAPPRLIFWETTRACNLECVHCRASACAERSDSELNTGEAKKFIEQAASFGKPILVFSGGEPLLRDDIYELAEHATEHGLKATIATNASLITGDVASRLKDSGIKMVAVSIYGPGSGSHDSFCGMEGALEGTLKGIENIKKAGIPLQINTTITKKNLHEMEAIGEFALELGAEAYHVFFLVPTGRGKAIAGDDISAEEYEKAFNDLYDFQLNFPLRVKATCAPHYYRILKQRNAKENRKTVGARDGFGAVTKGCLCGGGVCFISYEGEVFGCGYLPISAGNVREKDIKNILQKSDFFSILRSNLNLHGKCGVCEFKSVCGGCRARAYAINGDYMGEEPSCSYQPSTAGS